MTRRDEQDLLIKALQRRLSEAEKQEWERCLRSSAPLREAFAEEVALDRALGALPDVPLSSNFTARVLQEATREVETRRRGFRWGISVWHPAFASGLAVCLFIGGVALIKVRQESARRAEMAVKVRSFTEVASAIGSSETSPEELFQNFEAIQRLSLPAEGDVDMELLLALQK